MLSTYLATETVQLSINQSVRKRNNSPVWKAILRSNAEKTTRNATLLSPLHFHFTFASAFFHPAGSSKQVFIKASVAEVAILQFDLRHLG